jgi:protein-disulfide isomerase
LPRLLLGAVAVGLLAAVFSLSVGEGGPEKTTITGGEEVQQLIAGIPQDGRFLGASDAPVTITVFNDLQCGSCDDYQLQTVDPLIERYARTGDARLEFRNFSLGPTTTTEAAYAAAAAGEQDRQWQYVDLFFRNQEEAPGNEVSEDFLLDVANAIPDFEVEAWKRARESPVVSALVEDDAALAANLRLPADPAIVVTGPGGTRELDESPSKEQVEAAVVAVG